MGTIKLSSQSVADLGYVKLYLKEMNEFLNKQPDSIPSFKQRLSLERATTLLGKVSKEIAKQIKKEMK